MMLTVTTPRGRLLEEEAAKVSAEAVNGSFTLLPRHQDFVTAVVACVLVFETPDGRERLVAVDRGTLVKRGDRTMLSVRAAVEGTDLATLADTVREQFRVESDQDRKMRSSMVEIEVGMVRRFLEVTSEF